MIVNDVVVNRGRRRRMAAVQGVDNTDVIALFILFICTFDWGDIVANYDNRDKALLLINNITINQSIKWKASMFSDNNDK